MITLSNLGVKIPHNLLYIFYIFIISIFIRAVMIMFKTAAIRQGEQDGDGDKFSDKYKDRRDLFGKLFISRGKNRKLDDYFLPTILGSIELFVYPIIMSLGEWSFIIAWIGIKTAAHWKGWGESRTPYMRFLVGNALVLIASVFLTPLIEI